jgi:hypothetical protein
MALGVYFGDTGLNLESYKESVKRLKAAGAGHPKGRSFHTAFGPPDKLMVFDIWSSQAAFEKFGKTLMPILQQVGATPSAPMIMPIHGVITPPRAAAKKKPAKKGRKKR